MDCGPPLLAPELVLLPLAEKDVRQPAVNSLLTHESAPTLRKRCTATCARTRDCTPAPCTEYPSRAPGTNTHGQAHTHIHTQCPCPCGCSCASMNRITPPHPPPLQIVLSHTSVTVLDAGATSGGGGSSGRALRLNNMIHFLFLIHFESIFNSFLIVNF